jgi:hypothetical protein
MSFLAPWMLWGMAGASIPVVLHLFYRSRYRTVPWAAMKFLLTSIEQTSRRLRFQELLLLLCRTLLLALLGFALARPSSVASRGTADGDAVDAVLVFDVSTSMGAREGVKTRLERAKAAALAVVDHLPPRSTVQVIASADRAANLGPPAASNLDHAREAVKSVELSGLSTDHLPGVLEAAAALGRGHSPNKELWLFSDMQKSGWERQTSALKAKLAELAPSTAIHLVRCGTRAPRNATIVGLAPQSGIPHTGERAGFAILVRNSGTEPVRDLTVSLEVDGRGKERDTRAIPSLAPGETQAVTLSGRLDKAGLRVVTASVAPDELDADNAFSRVLLVREQARVLVVDGAPSEQRPESSASFYLMHSLRPVPESAWGAYHVQPRMVSPLEASPALLQDMDACILANVALPVPGENTPGALTAEFVERLVRFVREGKGLLVFPGPRAAAELYARVLFEDNPILPYKPSAPQSTPVRFDPASLDASGFLAAFRDEPLSRIAQAITSTWWGLDETENPDSKVLFRWSNGKAAVASRRVGAGEAILVTTSADPRWIDWPIRHTYLPFVHVMLSRLLEGPVAAHNRTAGEPLQWRASGSEASALFAVVDPAGKRTRLGVPSMVDNQPLVASADTARMGLYRIVPDVKDAAPEGVVFAVTPDARETEDLEALSSAQIDGLLGVRATHLVAGDDLAAFAGGERLKKEWTIWILVLVALLVACETVLAWYCGRGW